MMRCIYYFIPGIFGFCTLSVLLVAFYWIPAGIFSGNPRQVLEDVPDAFVQLGNNPLLIVAVLGLYAEMCINFTTIYLVCLL